MSLIKRRSFIKNNHGLAAVEFALAAPLLITLCLGGFELGRYTLINLKVEKIAFTLADVTSQNKTLTNSQINDIFEAAEQIASPFEYNNIARSYISSTYRAQGDVYPTVLWQRSSGSASHSSQVGSAGLTATLPNNLTINERDNLIISEIYYEYTPIFSLGLISASTLYKTTIFKPRLGDLTTSPT